MSQRYYVGLDAGSTTMKLAALDEGGDLLYQDTRPALPLVESQAQEMVIECEQNLGLAAEAVASTGYGRKLVASASTSLTEISCHSIAVFSVFARPGLLIDIGGQDTKVMRISAGGAVTDFAMNDKCAAGTGRFLENTAFRLGMTLEQLESAALETDNETTISSTCTVFAESEIISLVARAAPVPSVVRGLHRALVRRVAAMARGLGRAEEVFLTGGVALNSAVRLLLAQELEVSEIMVPQYPQIMGAWGAALVARSGKRVSTIERR